MKITHIHATNFLGIRSADVELRTPVALFCGPNGAGKSSIQDAVRLALAGESVRVALKKEYGRLVRDGAESGSIVVVADGGRANNVALPGGKITQTIPADPRTPFVLDAQRFASLDSKARRTFLFDLMGVTVGTDDVRKRLAARGITGDKVDAVLPLVRAGFDAAATEAQSKATAAKGAWRAVTGETYGSSKASSWTAKAPEGAEDAADLAAALVEGRDTIENFDRECADLQQQLGAIDAADRQRQQRDARAAALREAAAKLPKAEQSLERAPNWPNSCRRSKRCAPPPAERSTVCRAPVRSAAPCCATSPGSLRRTRLSSETRMQSQACPSTKRAWPCCRTR